MNIAKNTICLWYDHDAEEAARFYAQTFPDSSVGAIVLALEIIRQEKREMSLQSILRYWVFHVLV